MAIYKASSSAFEAPVPLKCPTPSPRKQRAIILSHSSQLLCGRRGCMPVFVFNHFISLLGVATVQAAEYYANFPQDTVRMKILVCRGGLLWIQQQLIIYTRLESSCEPASAPYQTLSN